MNYILDTNVYSALMRGDNSVVKLIKQAELIYLTPIVIGEILFGFRNGNKTELNIEQFQKFLSSRFVKELKITHQTADRYSRIATDLRLKGHPIPTNDIWIAAQTIESGGILLSYDQLFTKVDGLIWNNLQKTKN
ncbi:MAG: type II toxin-antitoxin system VapC family toxin [Gammaproteobacteria bacterium]|nr:type II toxin-antitoxin system VapC family toxin [Gammaproteobacteria bacterium]